MRKSISFPATVLAALILVVSSTCGASQRIALGPFIFDHSLDERGWVAKNPQIVQYVLESEGFVEDAEFLLVSPQGSQIYGTFWEATDVAITAEKIRPTVVPAEWYVEWGLTEGAVTDRIGDIAGMKAVLVEAVGVGNGLRFEKGGGEQTVGVWAIIPVVFEQHERLRSGLVRLFFRGKQEAIDIGDKKAFEALLMSARLSASIHIRTEREFYVYLGGGDWRKRPETIGSASASEGLPPYHWKGKLQIIFSQAGKPVPAARRLEALRELAEKFPANPYLGVELSKLEKQVAERELVGSYLVEENGEFRDKELLHFHESILAEVWRQSGTRGVIGYLSYLENVWPGNDLTSPPSENLEVGDVWRHPLLGLEMVWVQHSGGQSFWITRGSVGDSVARGNVRDGVRVPSSPTWQEAQQFGENYGLMLLPTVEQYKHAASRITTIDQPLWAASGSDGQSAFKVWLDSGAFVRARRARRDRRLKGGSFFLVLRQLQR